MRGKSLLSIALIISGFVLTGCGTVSDHQDLHQFMEEVKAQPKRPIEPLPQFTTYEAFTYSASGMRSPFRAPVKVEIVRKTRIDSEIKPDPDRG